MQCKIKESIGMSGGKNVEIESQKPSDACLKLLHHTVKAVSFGVSIEKINKALPATHLGECFYEYFPNSIYESIFPEVEVEEEACDKMNALDNIAKETPNNIVAWRPVTGTVDISAIEKWGTAMRKLNLENTLEELRKENDILRRRILEKREIIQQRKDALVHVD